MNNLLDGVRNVVRAFMVKVASVLNKITAGRLHPNVITLVGLLAHIYIAQLIAYHSLKWAAILLIIFGLFDALDGALARVQNRASKTGMLLDSITDRLKEVILYAGVAYAIIASGEVFYAVWAVLACGISIIVSYINAWGEVVTKDLQDGHTTNKAFRMGFMTFEIRMFVLVIGLLSGYLKQAVIFIAIFAFLTALQRFYLITQKLR